MYKCVILTFLSFLVMFLSVFSLFYQNVFYCDFNVLWLETKSAEIVVEVKFMV